MNRIEQTTDIRSLQLQHNKTSIGTGSTTEFAKLMQTELKKEGVQFSKHASDRIRQRGVDVSETLLTSLNQAVDKAREKGAKDAVIIGAQGAFVVNISNNVVVTTMTQQEMKENVFTNIDSAVLI